MEEDVAERRIFQAFRSGYQCAALSQVTAPRTDILKKGIGDKVLQHHLARTKAKKLAA